MVKYLRDSHNQDDFEELLPILERLDIPDTVKANLKVNLRPYLQAIEVSGYEKNKVRKLMIVGNTGIKRYLLKCKAVYLKNFLCLVFYNQYVHHIIF